ncbi:MAG TPA: S-layer homology domain-containing protein [Firmicutes bacterium]|nr:S-layer homology domain-containing protein [Bacillota bacterium]
MKHKLRKLLAMIMTLCMIIPTLATGAAATDTTTAPFTDIAGHWAEDTITRWADVGIVNGYPDGTFRPDEFITRAELAKIVTLAFGLETESDAPLADCDPDAWYYEYVRTAADYIPKYPYIVGYESVLIYHNNTSTGNFLPDEPVLRYHAADAFATLALEYGGMTLEIPEDEYEVHAAISEVFLDESIQSFPTYYHLFRPSNPTDPNLIRLQNSIYAVYKLGLMTGTPTDGGFYFFPFIGLSRAEVLTILDRILTPEEVSENMNGTETAEESEPVETEPVETEPVETEPVETELPILIF